MTTELQKSKYYAEHNSKIIFGANTLSQLGKELKKLNTTNVLLVYGNRSAKELHIYQKITDILRNTGISYTDLPRVESNPKCYSVRDGVSLCRRDNIDTILAIGGGSAIDCAKLISVSINYNGDPWDLVLHPHLIRESIPVGCILTRPSLGVESSNFAFITNSRTKEKKNVTSDLLVPSFAIIDPNYTVKLPMDMTKNHICALLSQIFEIYHFYTEKNIYLQYRMAETLFIRNESKTYNFS